MRSAILAIFAVATIAVPAGAKEKKPVDPNKKICHSQAVTGSMLGIQVCHTAAEWQSIDEANRRDTRAFEDKKTQGSANL